MGIRASIKAIEYYLPKGLLTNEMLAADFPEWSVEKIHEKTGISTRHITSKDECASDLGVLAAQKLFATNVCQSHDVDFLLFCSQSPDFQLPTTACIIQDRLGIPTSAGALDFNLGCSGFVYGLGLAKGLVETGQSNSLLLITADTYTKYVHPRDKSVRTLFGDGAAAILIRADPQEEYNQECIGPFVYGTDGSGYKNLIVPTSGMRQEKTARSALVASDDCGNYRSQDNLYMNGSEIFNFTLASVPKAVQELLRRSGKSLEEIDCFVFHQANQFMLEHLRKKVKIPSEKFHISMGEYGNTVSSTIPIAIKDALNEGKIKSGDLVMLVGFGVGYSWGATLIRWVS
ncbi:MAG: ketoacyl-ACP synthase III [Pirellula sp.]|jgi:3-oxoacyl-[acyl-carrier-protein] synthase-3